MAQKKINTAQAVKQLALPVVERLGLVIWDVLFQKEGPSWYLRIIIDKPGGVFIEDCEQLSRAIDPLIEELDPTEYEYILEVSSPGLGRELRTDEHLSAYIGREIVVKLYKPDGDGCKELSGVLVSFDENELSIMTDQQAHKLQRSAVASVKADDDKDLKGKV